MWTLSRKVQCSNDKALRNSLWITLVFFDHCGAYFVWRLAMARRFTKKCFPLKFKYENIFTGCLEKEN